MKGVNRMKKPKTYTVLPCPECYGSILLMKNDLLLGHPFRRHWVECHICGRVGPDRLTISGAVKAYNQGAYQQLIQRRAEADENAGRVV